MLLKYRSNLLARSCSIRVSNVRRRPMIGKPGTCFAHSANKNQKHNLNSVVMLLWRYTDAGMRMKTKVNSFVEGLEPTIRTIVGRYTENKPRFGAEMRKPLAARTGLSKNISGLASLNWPPRNGLLPYF